MKSQKKQTSPVTDYIRKHSKDGYFSLDRGGHNMSLRIDHVLNIARRAEFTIEAEPEEIEVRGNAMASGDAAADKAVEDEILRRLDQGDVWAWASVTVRCTLEGFEGRDHLGCCSYKDEADFIQPGGYYDDMRVEAFCELLVAMADARKRLSLAEGRI